MGKPHTSSDKPVTNEPQAAEWDAERARLQARIAALHTEVERLKDINALKTTLPQGLSEMAKAGSEGIVISMRLYRLIMLSLSPDNAPSDKEKQALLTKAFQEFKAVPVAFVDEKIKARLRKASEDLDAAMRERAEAMGTGPAPWARKGATAK